MRALGDLFGFCKILDIVKLHIVKTTITILSQTIYIVHPYTAASDHWLNVWCIRHTILETLREFRSRHRIGWIIKDFQEKCMSRSLTFCLETKMPWCQTPSSKKRAVMFKTMTMSAYQDQLNAGFSKVCEIFQVRYTESLKYVQEFYTLVCYCSNISKPLNMTRHKTKHDWLLYPSVIQPFKAAKVPRPSAVSLKVWLCDTRSKMAAGKPT